MSERPRETCWIEADWPAPTGIHAGTTTRQGGSSRAPFDSFNLATHVGDDPDAVADNRTVLRLCLNLPSEPRWLRQVHGTVIRDAAETGNLCADAAWTNRPAEVCAVLTADCVPILLCNRSGTEIAAVHAGWRGLSAGIISRAVARFQTEPDTLLAWLGPHIGPDHYPVGEEVRNACLTAGIAAPGGFTDAGAGHWLADLGQIARSALAECGVTACFGSLHCSFSRDDLYYSYRRDGVTGRMASLIWMEGRQRGV